MHRALPGLARLEGERFPNPARPLLSPPPSHLEMETADSLFCSTFSCCQCHAPPRSVRTGQRQPAPLILLVAGQVLPCSLRRGRRGQKRRWGWAEGSQKGPPVGTSPAVEAPQSGSSWRGYDIFPRCCTPAKPCSKGTSRRSLSGCRFLSLLTGT